MHICVVSREPVFARMLKLELEDLGHIVAVIGEAGRLPSAELYVIDRDGFPSLTPDGAILPYGYTVREEDGGLRRPFLLTDLAACLQAPTAERGIRLTANGVSLDGLPISLTERERALLACLMQAGGKPLSRRELLSAVWGEDDVEEGVVTVYLHYLRKKLERGGKKMLYAIRGRGYALRMEEEA